MKNVSSPVIIRWILGLTIAAIIIVPTIVYMRWTYEHTRRLRVVDPGKLYRCGRMLGLGLDETLKRHKIRTVINLMDEEPDPKLRWSYFGGPKVYESEICKANGVKFIQMNVDVLHPSQLGEGRPRTIDRFLEIMDNPENHPVLLHCRAGLHRTGVLTALYRMEYHNWTAAQAWHDLRRNGFGEHNCFADNPYIMQYVFSYRPGLRQGATTAEVAPHEIATPFDSLIKRTSAKPERFLLHSLDEN